MDFKELFENHENIINSRKSVIHLHKMKLISQESKNEIEKKIIELEKECNTYVTKPFHNNEMMEKTAWIFMISLKSKFKIQDILMKINRLETHDRLEHFTKQSFDIGQCCQNLIDQKPFGMHAFYIFAHTRTDDDGVTKRLIWQPRLTKPKSQENSMLFKAYPGSDNIKVIWMIPARELWNQYTKGLMLQNETVQNSISLYRTARHVLDLPEPDDLPDWRIDAIYRELSQQARHKKATEIFKREPSGASVVLKEAQESCQDLPASSP